MPWIIEGVEFDCLRDFTSFYCDNAGDGCDECIFRDSIACLFPDLKSDEIARLAAKDDIIIKWQNPILEPLYATQTFLQKHFNIKGE